MDAPVFYKNKYVATPKYTKENILLAKRVLNNKIKINTLCNVTNPAVVKFNLNILDLLL